MQRLVEVKLMVYGSKTKFPEIMQKNFLLETNLSFACIFTRLRMNNYPKYVKEKRLKPTACHYALVDLELRTRCDMKGPGREGK